MRWVFLLSWVVWKEKDAVKEESERIFITHDSVPILSPVLCDMYVQCVTCNGRDGCESRCCYCYIQ